MNLRDYQLTASRTVNMELPYELQLTDKGLGICGELSELMDLEVHPYESANEQQEEVMAEGGDVLWYVVNLCTILDEDWTKLLPTVPMLQDSPKNNLNMAFRYAGAIADVIKKHTSQKHDLDKARILICLKELLAYLVEVFDHYDLTLPEICAYNHIKLMRRYKDGFSTEASVHREI